LIDNAIKYTDNGRVEVTIDRNNDGCIIVSVEDTGIGISDEFMKNIFKPFLQEESGYSRRYEGNGLGLALTKKYCELNNATINVESQKGAGSKFIITFKNAG
jgi:signal transduction histidine kinase